MLTTAFLRSPDILLASFFIEDHAVDGLHLLCAPSGAGKTTWLLELYRLAQEAGLATGGLLSPPVFQNGQKTAIDLLDASTGARVCLAAHREQPPLSEVNGPDTLGWVFDPAAITWGNQVLGHSTACDLFFLDEMGPLEWLYGQGLVQGFAALDNGGYRVAIVSVRPSLLPHASARWPQARLLETRL